MASSTTTGHEHEYMRQGAEEPCIFCGAPRPADAPTGGPRYAHRYTPDGRVESRRVDEIPGGVQWRVRFLADSDPGDED